jgi:hypothetical protein
MIFLKEFKQLCKVPLLLLKVSPYNSIFAFTSMSASLMKNSRIDEQLTKEREEFRVEGTISHCIGTLLPIESRTPNSAKLYVFDCDMEAQINIRCCIMGGFDGEIVATIHRVLNQVNLFVEIFLKAGEFISNQEVLTARLVNYETPRVDL